MSYINNLIRQAKAEPPPVEIVVTPNRVGTVIEHAVACMGISAAHNDAARELVRHNLKTGGMKLLGVPLRIAA